MTSFPKPTPRVIDRVALRQRREAEAQAFRSAVWKRDEGRCRVCSRRVVRTLELIPHAGHVHHRRGRNVAPEDRYSVDRAVLLCAVCHADPEVVLRLRKGA
jgi:5-methylcytosine-specific restriction endonuclease McrA